jgi:hypothetical protein
MKEISGTVGELSPRRISIKWEHQKD